MPHIAESCAVIHDPHLSLSGVKFEKTKCLLFDCSGSVRALHTRCRCWKSTDLPIHVWHLALCSDSLHDEHMGKTKLLKIDSQIWLLFHSPNPFVVWIADPHRFCEVAFSSFSHLYSDQHSNVDFSSLSFFISSISVPFPTSIESICFPSWNPISILNCDSVIL